MSTYRVPATAKDDEGPVSSRILLEPLGVEFFNELQDGWFEIEFSQDWTVEPYLYDMGFAASHRDLILHVVYSYQDELRSQAGSMSITYEMRKP